MVKSELLVTRLAGAVWGHLIGDAVGVPYEFRSVGHIGEVRFGATGSHRQPAGTWSDDGALMLALLDSLLAVGFHPQDQAARALAWRDSGAYTPDGDGAFDIGTTTGRALAAKAIELRPGLKVLFASGYFEGALVGKGELERDVQFLAKPYRRQELVRKIEEVLKSTS